MLPFLIKEQKNIIKAPNNYCYWWVNMQEWQADYQIFYSPPLVGQHAGITTTSENIFRVGQHAGMVGQHEQEWWVNMVRNL